MAKINFHAIEDSEKENIFQAISSQKGIPAFAVEKDWWVTQALSIIFEMDAAKHLVFKGGTSLSKAWKLIQRFSEDIDLAIDRKFLGFDGELSKNQRTELRKVSGKYTTGPFFEQLGECFQEKGFKDVKLKILPAQDSDQDPRIIEVYYPNIIKTSGYVLPKIQIEIGCRSLREPFTNRIFGSLVDEVYEGEDFTAPLITIPTVDAERTFLEKIFLLHEEFHRPVHKIRVNRLSRHLYDVYQLMQTNVAERAINDKTLYETIVSHRQKLSKISGIDYNHHNPKNLDPIPPAEVSDTWKDDYKKLLEEMIYEENPPTFEMLTENLKAFKERLAKVEWRFSLEFPRAW